MKKLLTMVAFPLFLALLFIVPGVSATEPIPVSIDIKPWSCPNSINLKSKGVVPVAIKQSLAFDITMVNVSTVLFAGASPVPDKMSIEDADGDGDIDLILFFKTQDLALSPGDTEATLTGYTTGGIFFTGSGSVNIVPK